MPCTFLHKYLLLNFFLLLSGLSGRSATLVWDQNPEENVSYYVYRMLDGQNVRIDTGTNTFLKLHDLRPGVTYTFYVTARDTDGLESSPSETITYAVARPNLPPTVTLAEPLSGSIVYAPGSINLSAKAFDADGSIQCVEYFANSVKIGQSSVFPFPFTWTNVPAGLYSFTAAATDNSGGRRFSGAATMSVLPRKSKPTLKAPFAPARFVSRSEAERIHLSWISVPTATSYSIKRATSLGGPYVAIATGLTGPKYSDEHVEAGKLYFYIARASNSSGESANSAIIAARTRSQPPAAPSRFTASAGAQGIDLRWMAGPNTLDLTIKRSFSQSGPFLPIAEGITGTRFIDKGASSGKVCYYMVAARNEFGYSPNTPVASPMVAP